MLGVDQTASISLNLLMTDSLQTCSVGFQMNNGLSADYTSSEVSDYQSSEAFINAHHRHPSANVCARARIVTKSAELHREVHLSALDSSRIARN